MSSGRHGAGSDWKIGFVTEALRIGRRIRRTAPLKALGEKIVDLASHDATTAAAPWFE